MPTLDVKVFIPRGPVQRNHILKAALAQVRDTLPPTLTCDPAITAAERRPDDHEQPGTDYVVTIDYTERGTGSNHASLPVGTFGYSPVADGEDADIDGVEKAFDALAPSDAADALKANGQAPEGV